MKIFDQLRKEQKVCLMLFAGGFIGVIGAFMSTSVSSTGANIGAGILFLLGQLSIIIGLIGSAICSKRTWIKVSIAIFIVLSVYFQYASWRKAEDRLNITYCKEKSEKGQIRTDEADFCSKYLSAE
jgi:hypothetical protein